jgi:hypothetical protein
MLGQNVIVGCDKSVAEPLLRAKKCRRVNVEAMHLFIVALRKLSVAVDIWRARCLKIKWLARLLTVNCKTAFGGKKLLPCTVGPKIFTAGRLLTTYERVTGAAAAGETRLRRRNLQKNSWLSRNAGEA